MPQAHGLTRAVPQVKVQLSVSLSLPVRQLAVTFKFKPLNDAFTLEACGVCHKASASCAPPAAARPAARIRTTTAIVL